MREFLKHIAILLLVLPFFGTAQTFGLPEGQKVEKLRFQVVNNLIVVPIEVNGTELSFLLDSGVSKPILFNLSDKDSVQINNVSEITIRGLGEGEPIKALSSTGNSFKIRNIKNDDQQLYVIMDKNMNLSPSLGMPIHGIIGYDLFRDFVVDVNYGTGKIVFHDPEYYTYQNKRKDETLPLSIIKNKAYVDGNLLLKDEELPVKLLVDTGSSDALWLFEDNKINMPEKYYDDFLGRGLGGNIYGKRTKVKSMKIGRFTLTDAKAAFPDKNSFGSIINFGSRNGSVGGEVLRRFNIIFDYPSNKITLRKNSSFHAPWSYNLSGLSLQHNGVRYLAESISDSRGLVHSDKKEFGDVQILFETHTRLSLVPEIVVSSIRAGSPAFEAGLKEGDVILAVNGRRVHRYKLQEVLEMINEREGKRIKLLIERYNSDLLFTFVLKNMLK